MRGVIWIAVLAGALAACAPLPATERTPFLPPGVFGTYLDNATGAINFAAWAFASPANTRGNPVEATRAVVAMEYLPGELRENPRWVGVDAAVKLHMGRSRAELREILGIPLTVPPQLVVNTMLALALDLQTGNQPAAMEVLASPIFTKPPEQTLQVLANLPYIQEANLATSRADSQSFRLTGELR